MKTQEQKLQHVMEAAGEHGHGHHNLRKNKAGWWYCIDVNCPHSKMGISKDLQDAVTGANPSPDDLNELFRLAEKLEYKVINTDIWADTHFANITRLDRHAWHKGQGGTRTRALLNALFIATGGKDE